MILGIDCGTRTFGWAVVDPRTAIVVDLGALVQDVDSDVARTTDSSRRVSYQTDSLITVHRDHGITAVVHEAGSYNARRFKMTLGLALSIGAVVGFARALDVPLDELPPKRWQHAISGTGGKGKIDYDDVYRRVEAYVARYEPALRSLYDIKSNDRNHALDAAGIALCHAIDPTLATRVR